MTIVLENEDAVKDELYLILIKQSRNNPRKESMERVWHILALACSIILPSKGFLPALYNYLLMVIDNHPEQRFKEWAHYSLKRLYNLDKNKFKRNFGPSDLEIHANRHRKQILLPIYLQNGGYFTVPVESYFSTQEILRAALNALDVGRKFWPYFHLVDIIIRNQSIDERPLADPIMIGDVLAGWELMHKNSETAIRSSRLFLTLKYFPDKPEVVDHLLPFIYFAKIFECISRNVRWTNQNLANL